MLLAICVLRRHPSCTDARRIKSRVSQRLDMWDSGRIGALVADDEAAGRLAAGASHREPDEDRMARAFNAAVLDGQVSAAVRRVQSMGGGGVLGPQDSCTKSGRPVLEVLQEKHPDTREPVLDDDNCLCF